MILFVVAALLAPHGLQLIFDFLRLLIVLGQEHLALLVNSP